MTGRRKKADAILAELRGRAQGDYISPAVAAQIAAALGKIDEAFEWLERAYEDRSPFLSTIGVAPAYDPLRGDPRFSVMLKKIGLEGVVPATG